MTLAQLIFDDIVVVVRQLRSRDAWSDIGGGLAMRRRRRRRRMTGNIMTGNIEVETRGIRAAARSRIADDAINPHDELVERRTSCRLVVPTSTHDVEPVRQQVAKRQLK